jgi:hypothetical protein
MSFRPLFSSFKNAERWTKSKHRVILSIIDQRQNPVETSFVLNSLRQSFYFYELKWSAFRFMSLFFYAIDESISLLIFKEEYK